MSLENYALAGLVLAILGIFGVEEVRIANLQSEVAHVERQWADDRALAERTVRLQAQKLGDIQATHAAQQQEREDAWNKKQSELEARRRADAGTIVGLRGDIAAYTARGPAGDQADPAACQRAWDRLDTLGGLLAEGVELVVEGRQRVEARDAEVKLLVDQLTADRAAIDSARGESGAAPGL